MRRHSLVALALTLAPFSGLFGQATAVPVDAKISVSGFTAADSLRITRAVRAGLQADSHLRIVYRPPRDSIRYMLGQDFEVARIRVVLDVSGSREHPVLTADAIDVVSSAPLAHTRSDLAQRQGLEATADTVLRSFALQVAKQVK